MKLITALMFLTLLWFNVFAAPVTIYEFDSKEKEAIFYKLSDELRCLVCQNQNIAESNSELAQDLKRQIYNMLKKDKSEDEIIEFMVERYGDYVLYNPPFKPLTWLLWLGPLVVFIIAAIIVIRAVRNQENTELSKQEYSSDDSARLDGLKTELKNLSDKDTQ